MGAPGPNCKPRICILCGREFIPKSSRQKYCNQDTKATCAYCGKTFIKKCTTSDTTKCCSETCTIEYMKSQRVKNSLSKIKICKWCGKKFHAKSVRTVYCSGPHYKECEVCGRSFELDVKLHRDRRTCSKECLKILQVKDRDFKAEHEKQKKSLLCKYGVDNAAKIPGSSEKMKNTMLKRYGKEWYTQTNEYKDRIQKLSLEKYGVDHWLSSKDVINKRKQTSLEKYGAENVFASDYGKQKIAEYWESTYGVSTISQVHIKDINKWKLYQQDSAKYVEDNYPEGTTIQELAHDLGVCVTSIWNFLDEETLQNKIHRNFSTMETGVSLMLRDLKPDIEIHHNRRKLISPYEIDIFLPEYNIGIECNPTYTHNSSDSGLWDTPSHDSKYHLMKTELAEEQGIFLFHLFGYEWNHKTEIIESMFRNMLHLNTRKIFARNAQVKDVPYTDCKIFLDMYHRQGNAMSSVRLGLYFENELVSVMTFGKPRKSISSSIDQNESTYELIRFCSKFSTSVVGGASKLFTYFINIYNPDKIISYSDKAHTQGRIYPILGFKHVKITEPGYVWVNVKTDKAYNRYNTQKHNLSKFLDDPDIDLSKTEKQIMEEHGYVQVFDSGNVVWEWTR